MGIIDLVFMVTGHAMGKLSTYWSEVSVCWMFYSYKTDVKRIQGDFQDKLVLRICRDSENYFPKYETFWLLPEVHILTSFAIKKWRNRDKWSWSNIFFILCYSYLHTSLTRESKGVGLEVIKLQSTCIFIQSIRQQ